MRHLVILGLFLTLVSRGFGQEPDKKSIPPTRTERQANDDDNRRKNSRRRSSQGRPASPQLVTRKNDDGTISGKWKSPLLGRAVSCRVRLPKSADKKNPVVVYLKNLPAPRLGTLDDATLINQFLGQGMVVIEADYAGDARAVAPKLLPEIDLWYGYLFNTKEHSVDPDWIYIIPAGYTIDRKIRVCEIPGRPVDMDVIYPSGSSAPVPLMLQITSTKDSGKWINQRAYYIYGLLTTGYAGAIMDYNGGAKVSPKGEVFMPGQIRSCNLMIGQTRYEHG